MSFICIAGSTSTLNPEARRSIPVSRQCHQQKYSYRYFYYRRVFLIYKRNAHVGRLFGVRETTHIVKGVVYFIRYVYIYIYVEKLRIQASRFPNRSMHITSRRVHETGNGRQRTASR